MSATPDDLRALADTLESSSEALLDHAATCTYIAETLSDLDTQAACYLMAQDLRALAHMLSEALA